MHHFFFSLTLVIPKTVAATESPILRPSHLSLSQDADVKMGCPDTEVEDKFMNIRHFENYEHKMGSLSLKVKKKEKKTEGIPDKNQVRCRWNDGR